jgi:hypothetical protein
MSGKPVFQSQNANKILTSVILAGLGAVLLSAVSGCAGSSNLCELETQEARAVADARQQGMPMSTIIAAIDLQTEQDPNDASIKSGAIMKRIIAEVYERSLNPDAAADMIHAECESGR